MYRTSPTLRYVADVAPAGWIRARLHPFAQDAGAVVPEGFDAYARVFHPASRGDRPVTWRAIAEANGRTAHRQMQFGNVAGSWRASTRPDLWTTPPTSGTLTRELARALADALRAHTATPNRCWFAAWEGWGGFNPGTPRFEHPNRRYYLAEGALAEAASSVYDHGWPFQSPSIWWPDDRSWCVATEVDLDSTYVGGSRACIDALLAGAGIEALLAELTDDITIAGDKINPPPPTTPSRAPGI